MQRITSVLRMATTLGARIASRTIYPVSGAMHSVMHQPTFLPTSSPMLNQVCGFKLRGIVRRRCKSCFFVVRDGRMHVICKEHPRHKQMAMRPKPHNTWVLTHATQSKVRPW